MVSSSPTLRVSDSCLKYLPLNHRQDSAGSGRTHGGIRWRGTENAEGNVFGTAGATSLESITGETRRRMLIVLLDKILTETAPS